MQCHQDDAQALSAEETYRRATLVAVRRCPARADYLEIRFDVDGRDWRWCFPGSMSSSSDKRPGPLALTMTRVGIQARAFEHGVVGACVRLEVTIPSILAGAPTFLHESLTCAG